jgi:hypothetical protein
MPKPGSLVKSDSCPEARVMCVVRLVDGGKALVSHFCAQTLGFRRKLVALSDLKIVRA